MGMVCECVYRIDVCMHAMIVEESWAAWLFVWWTELKCMLGVWNVGLTKHRYEYVNRSLSYTIINISTIAIDSQQSVDSAHISIHLILAIAEMNRLCVCVLKNASRNECYRFSRNGIVTEHIFDWHLGIDACWWFSLEMNVWVSEWVATHTWQIEHLTAQNEKSIIQQKSIWGHLWFMVLYDLTVNVSLDSLLFSLAFFFWRYD